METQINGIPCIVHYTTRGKYIPAKVNAPPEDCYEAEYPDIEFTVCDHNGHPAAWLEAKLTYEDRQRIEAEILNQDE